jgi:hypothetical protein
VLVIPPSPFVSGSIAGGFTRSYIGGTYFEKEPGEKFAKLQKCFTTCINEVGPVEVKIDKIFA